MAPKRRKIKAAHYRGAYHVISRRLLATARADPSTRCWRCGRTLAQHPLGANGKPQYWTAGHVIDGEINGLLLPEASRCNIAAGNRRKTRRTTLTW